MPLSVYLSGMGLGASLIIAIGAQNAFVLRQGVRGQYVFLVAAVCTAIDWGLIMVGAAGFGSLIGRWPLLTTIAAWGGAVFLIIYGGLAFRSAIRGKYFDVDEDEGKPVDSARSVILVALAVSLLNPHVYLDTVILIGGLAAQYAADVRPVFALGAGTASMLWFFGLAYGARLLEPIFMRPAARRVLDLTIGVIMWGIGVSLILGEATI